MGTSQSAWIAWNALETKPWALHMRSCLALRALAQNALPVFASQPHLEASISNFELPRAC